MNQQTAEMLGFLKGLRLVSVYCDKTLIELEGAPTSVENIEYEGGIRQVKEFCEEQIDLYQNLFKEKKDE